MLHLILLKISWLYENFVEKSTLYKKKHFILPKRLQSTKKIYIIYAKK